MLSKQFMIQMETNVSDFLDSCLGVPTNDVSHNWNLRVRPTSHAEGAKPSNIYGNKSKKSNIATTFRLGLDSLSSCQTLSQVHVIQCAILY